MTAETNACPTLIEKAEDILTDLQLAATRFKLEGKGGYLGSKAIVSLVTDLTRRYPLTALSAAFGLGMWIKRKRY